MAVRVHVVPCLADNYAYVVVGARGAVAIVDPSEHAPVLRVLDAHGLAPSALWLTHHHHDHVGGIEGLVARFPEVEVVGSKHDAAHGRIPRLTRAVGPGDPLWLDDAPVRVMEVPGHTLGAITFVVGDDAFTGDTLFLAGCGRVFEGTMPMMAASMRAVRALPASTRIWCGHEYTVSNLAFAQHEEPTNAAITRALDEARARVARGEPTVPGTLARELEVNPFLRFDAPALARGEDADASFTRLREAKNVFRA